MPTETFTPVAITPNPDAPLYRYFQVRKADAESENTFQVKMSSEFPGEQRATKEHERLGIAKEGEKYIEILSHEDGDVDLSRFVGDNRAPLLDEHKDNRHLGYIKTAALSKDKTTRGVIVFDQISKLSKTRSKEVAGDSRPNFSIGYSHTRYLGPVAMEDGKTGHRFAWQGLELSNVAVPMDPGAQKGRGKNSDVHCIRCGDIYTKAQLNDDFVCKDCADSEDTDDGSRAAGERMFRVKKDDKDFHVSHNDLRHKVVAALDSDKRFKTKRDNGDMVSDFYHHDIHQTSADATQFQAIIQSPSWSRDSKYHAVDFTYNGKDVTLGESSEVEPKTTFEAIERGLPFDAKQFRVKPLEVTPPVDSAKLATESAIVAPQILTRTNKNMADNATPPTITPELVIDNLGNPHVARALADKGYRTQVEIQAAEKAKSEKLAARNTEILALEKEFCRDFGTRITHVKRADGSKDPQYLRDGFHIAAMEACGMDETKADTEVRQIFRAKVEDLKRDSVAEENVMRRADEANDPEGPLASRCTDMFDVIKRSIKNAHTKGLTSKALPADGADMEFTDEMRNVWKNIPGGGRMADLGGFCTPRSKGRKVLPSEVRGAAARMTRDALAGDFATVGAMIAPQFRPYIELLRNKIVLANLGCTYIGGCMGEQVFPRQQAATVAQSLPEGNQLNAYDQALGQIKMAPHRVGSRQFYSRLALIQAPPDFESMVWNDHSKVLALYQDEMGINGSGAADQPIGILNQPGIAQLLFGGTPTYAQLLTFRTNIRKMNMDGPLAFCTTSVGQGRLAYLPAALSGSTVITQGSLDAMWKGDEIDGEMLGCKAIASQQIPGDILLAGVFEALMIASWGGIFTIVDNLTRADRDEVAITFNTYFDIAVKHPEAFCRSMDSVNQ